MFFNPIEPNGFTTYVMNSRECADKIINTFQDALNMDYDAEDALNYAVRSNGINKDDLTASDIEYINEIVNQLI